MLRIRDLLILTAEAGAVTQLVLVNQPIGIALAVIVFTLALGPIRILTFGRIALTGVTSLTALFLMMLLMMPIGMVAESLIAGVIGNPLSEQQQTGFDIAFLILATWMASLITQVMTRHIYRQIDEGRITAKSDFVKPEEQC